MSSPESPPAPRPRAPDLAALLAQACGLLAAGVGVSALIGWIAGIAALHSVRSALVPTAPSTGMSLVVLGAAGFALARWPERQGVRRAVTLAALLVSVLTALLIAQFVGEFDLGLEAVLVSTAQTIEGTPLGRMAPLSAAGLLLASLSLIALATYPSGTAAGRRAASAMALAALAIGAISLAGYALGAPLLYHSQIVPVALPTAAALSLLGVGVLITAVRAPRGGAGGGPAPARRPRILRYAPAALGAGATALLTIVAAGILRRLDESRLQAGLESRASSVATALQSALDQGLTNVRSVATAVAIDDVVTRPEFRVFAEASRPTHSRVIGVAWAPSVPADERARFEAAARQNGTPGFRITERGPAGDLVPAGRRHVYVPVLFAEPTASFAALLGFDAGSEPAAADAFARARGSAAPVVSAGFTLATDASGQATVLAVEPVFREPPRRPAAPRGALRGYAVGIIRLAALVQENAGRLGPEGITLTVRDLHSGRPEALYGPPPPAPARPFLAHAETLRVGDRSWSATFVPTAAYAARQWAWSAWALLAAGLLFAFLIGAHLFGMEGYASDLETARETLHASEARFRAISESAVDGIITIDAQGTIVHCNASALREFGYEEGGLLGRNVTELVPASHVAAHTAGLAGYLATGAAPIAGTTVELPALRRDRSEFPIDLSLATWETREGRFATAIVRDITERRSSQDERERLIAELTDALANVKTLSGLLPVCSWCHKVLDDRGAWRQMEAYVHEHTDADFSHGICPDCEKKYLSGDG